MYFLLNMGIFRCYVSLPEDIWKMALFLGVNGIHFTQNITQLGGDTSQITYPKMIMEVKHDFVWKRNYCWRDPFCTSKSSKGTPPEVEQFAQFTDHFFQRIVFQYTPVNEHSNGKWTFWRCISFGKWWYSIAMLVCQRVIIIFLKITMRN